MQKNMITINIHNSLCNSLNNKSKKEGTVTKKPTYTAEEKSYILKIGGYSMIYGMQKSITKTLQLLFYVNNQPVQWTGWLFFQKSFLAKEYFVS